MKSNLLFGLIFCLMTNISFSDETKAEDTKKEEKKTEEVKKEEPKKESKEKVVKKPKECFYRANSLASVPQDKFDEEVKKIESNFEKCQAEIAKEKERELKQQECSKTRLELKDKKSAIAKMLSNSKIANKEEFDKLLPELKSIKEEASKLETSLNENCPRPKLIVKKEEPKKEEPKKEEPKKEESKKEEPKKEEEKK